MSKSPDAFRTISEVADWLGVQAHVLRFWESRFSQVKPVKRAGGRRYYRPADMLLLGGIKKLLHDDGLTIKGVQKMLREHGVAHISDLSQALEEPSITTEPKTGTKGATIVRFKERLDEADATDAEPPEAQISMQLEPESTDTNTTPESEQPEPEANEEIEGRPALPAFLHRPMAAPEPPSDTATEDASHEEPIPEPEAAVAASPEAVAEPDEAPRDIPDPPDADALPYAPGALARLVLVERLTPDQARDIAPLAEQLRLWHDQAAKMGTG
ncbi:MerR family transcriptional regulator [Seohaeicola saemankumensis]|nr:MerR family transcriptional regulator [Seohaeicola saemankumensis]MCA0872841.1 MerR family transcriptional regulator [Seohaeicola saemankumensis]